VTRREKILFRSIRHKFDPLDLEILERAFVTAWQAVKERDCRLKSDGAHELEALLRRELIEIASLHGVSDPETLQDLLLAGVPPF
jgi:hypothetical protein